MNKVFEDHYSKSKYYHSWDLQAVWRCLVLKLSNVGHKEIAEQDEHLDKQNQDVVVDLIYIASVQATT